MSGGQNSVTLSFAGDSQSLDRTVANVDKSLDGMKTHADKASAGTRELGEGLEHSVGKFRGGKDVLDGFSDSMGAFGLALPGPIGNIAGLAGGLADLADGIGTTALPLLKSLWATLAANPLVLIIGGIALLAAGLVLAYKKSETFRDIVNGVFKDVKTAVQVLGDVFAKVANALFQPFKYAFNAIARAWNATVGGFGFSIPGWVPFVGGDSFKIPNIPTFANGGRVPGGPVWVGERGPELVNLPGGALVTGNGRTAPGGGGQQVQVVLTFQSTGDPVLDALRRSIKAKGGNVQVVLGSGF